MEHAVQSDVSKDLMLWGHSLEDYREMFDLNDEDLTKKILDCYPGPASFNAELHQQQHDITSCDEIFSLSHPNIENHIIDIFQSMLARVRQQENRFIWDKVGSIDELAKARQEGINTFLDDFDEGKQQQRYISAKLHDLPFDNFQFDLALCSHYLFGSRVNSSLEIHMAAILEMCRVATEVRIFPLLASTGEISPLVGPIMLQLQQNNLGVEIREVPYQIQKNGNAMLRIWALECSVD